MSSRMSRICLFSLILLYVIPGICQQKWEVKYSKTNICAVKGSTILLSASYKHPYGLKVTEIFWILNPAKGKTDNLLDLQGYKGRVEYFNNSKIRTIFQFVAKLSNVTHNDEGMYSLRIVTNEEKEKYMGYPGIELSVTELSVEIPEEVVERKSSVLLCKSSCNLADRANFIWYKNGEAFPESISTNELKLQSVSSDDAGNYSCATRDQKHLPSPAVTLNVRYPPRSVWVSMNGSAEIVEGGSVTLSCSSDSNPPALNFSWFKENESSAVGSGQSFSISSFNSSHSGRFYCEAYNPYGSQRSASVSVTVKGVQRAAQHTVIGTVAVCGGLIVIIIIIVIIVFVRKKKRDGGAQVIRQIQQDHSGRSAEMDPTNDVPLYSLVSVNQRGDLYASVKPKKHTCSGRDEPGKDEVQYVSVHYFKNKDTNETEESGYQNMKMQHPSDANRSDDVIYSSVK